MTFKVDSPGKAYRYDIGEKDAYYDHASGHFILDEVTFTLKGYLSSNKLLTDVTMTDRNGNTFTVPNFDLMKLIHKYDTRGDLLYAETIEEEFNRFGMGFRREHGEFYTSQQSDQEMQRVMDRIERLSITNNCLDPTKWELWIGTTDYSDWNSRRSSKINFNEMRTLSHSWFYFDKDLLTILTKIKNPEQPHDYPSVDYEEASAKAEQTKVEFSQYRAPVLKTFYPTMLEVGHQSKRILEPVDMEEHYKWEYGLFINKQSFTNYSNILDQPVQLARFTDRGYYNPETPNIYDYGFLRHLDKVELRQLKGQDTDGFYEIRITGQHAPYEVTLGNVDLSWLSHLKMHEFLFGFNTYPKGRRYNHKQNTTSYDPDTHPHKEIRPYLLMTDRHTGNYVNNQKKGVEKLYIAYENSNRKNIVIYLLSYERITPVWMARLKVPAPVFKTTQIRKNIF